MLVRSKKKFATENLPLLSDVYSWEDTETATFIKQGSIGARGGLGKHTKVSCVY